MGALYDALLLAKLPDDVAREAAEEVAAFDTRLARIEGELKVIRWMLGTLIALNMGLLFLVLRIPVR